MKTWRAAAKTRAPNLISKREVGRTPIAPCARAPGQQLGHFLGKDGVELDGSREVASEYASGLLARVKVAPESAVGPPVDVADAVDIVLGSFVVGVERLLRSRFQAVGHRCTKRSESEHRALRPVKHDRKELTLLTLGHENRFSARRTRGHLPQFGRDT